jgi:hypothetical protein
MDEPTMIAIILSVKISFLENEDSAKTVGILESKIRGK